MKNFKRSRISALILGAVVLVGTLGCDISGLQDSIDNFGLVIGLEEINTGATVLVTDAKTGELINPDITVTFGGQNGDDVIDMYSDPITEDEIDGGILNFAISNTVVPSAGSPAKVTLNLSAKGYISASKTITLADTGFVDFSVSLVKKSNAPASIKTTTTSTTTNTDGSLAADLSISSDTTGGNAGTSLSIPTGTSLVSSNGTVLTGQLSAELTNYDPGDPDALSNFPIEIGEGEEDPVVVAGMNSVQITDANGNVATGTSAAKLKGSASNLFTVTIVVSPEIGVSVGDQIYVEAGNVENGNFDIKFSAYQNVIDLGSGKIGVILELNFLPEYSYAWFYANSSYAYYSTFDVTRNGYSGDIKAVANSYGLSWKFQVKEGNSNELVFNTNSSFFNVHVTDPVDVVLTYDTAPASGSAFPIVLPQAPSNIIDANVNVVLRCPNPDEKVSVTDIPQSSVLFRKTGTTGKWRIVTAIKWAFDDATQSLKGGSFKLSGVEGGASYDFKFAYDGNTESKTAVVSATTNITVSDKIKSICD